MKQWWVVTWLRHHKNSKPVVLKDWPMLRLDRDLFFGPTFPTRKQGRAWAEENPTNPA